MLGRANGIPLVHTKSMTIISVKEEKKKTGFQSQTDLDLNASFPLAGSVSWERPSVVLGPPFLHWPLDSRLL